MPRVKFTERTIAQLPAPHPSGQIIYWDAALKGFGVLCSGTSSAKSYVVKGSVAGRSIRKTIGRVELFTLVQARRKAIEMLGGFVGGIDPRANRSSNITLNEALEAYLRAREGNLRPRSISGYRGEIERHLADWLNTPLKNINREMVEARHRAIAAEIAESRGMNGNATSNRVLRSFRALYNHTADRVVDLPPNPVRLRQMWHPVEPRERCLRGSEFARFYKAASELPNPVGRDYTRLLLFTGLRRGEASMIRWADVDFERQMFTIPAANTKTNRKLELPLTDVVRQILETRHSLGRTEYVFFSTSASGHVEEPKSFFRDIGEASGVRISPHDLRRSYLTVAESCDISPLALAALANHTMPGVTSQYVRFTVDRLREPAQKVADKLKALCGI